MMDALDRLADFSVLAFVVLSMLAMVMNQRLSEVVAPLKDARTVGGQGTDLLEKPGWDGWP